MCVPFVYHSNPSAWHRVATQLIFIPWMIFTALINTAKFSIWLHMYIIFLQLLHKCCLILSSAIAWERLLIDPVSLKSGTFNSLQIFATCPFFFFLCHWIWYSVCIGLCLLCCCFYCPFCLAIIYMQYKYSTFKYKTWVLTEVNKHCVNNTVMM